MPPLILQELLLPIRSILACHTHGSAWYVSNPVLYLRITAAAGTELADPYSYGTYKKPHVANFIPV